MATPKTQTILWRRIDAAGHDACSLLKSGAGWVLEGMAIFRDGRLSVRLVYRVECDRAWVTRRGRAHGWVGKNPIDLRIVRTARGKWIVNGKAVPDLGDCLDLDFGFTPATNLLPMRRLALKVGQSADAPAAWLGVRGGSLRRLGQRYERRSRTSYWYEAPRFRYAALLTTTSAGFVRSYPRLWEAEPSILGS